MTGPRKRIDEGSDKNKKNSRFIRFQNYAEELLKQIYQLYNNTIHIQGQYLIEGQLKSGQIIINNGLKGTYP
jgi:hypothetical protein